MDRTLICQGCKQPIPCACAWYIKLGQMWGPTPYSMLVPHREVYEDRKEGEGQTFAFLSAVMKTVEWTQLTNGKDFVKMSN